MSVGLGPRGVLGAIACIATFGVGQGMTYPLFAVRLEQMGWSGTGVGLSAAMVAVATLTLTPLAPRAIARIGLAWFLALGAAGSAAALAAFALTDDPWVWLALRYVHGAAATALYVGSEAWIVAGAPPARRGRVVGLYATMLSLGFAAGPGVIALTGFQGAAPFLVCAALSLLCLWPLAWAWRAAPAAAREAPLGGSPWRFFRTDPSVLWAVTLFGMVEFGVMGLLPVWGVAGGMAPAAAGLLVSALVLGNVALQIPLGVAAERMDRRVLLAACALTCLAAAVALPHVAGAQAALWITLFLAGGMAGGLYTVGLIELGARHSGAALVAANAAVIMGYGAGALGGPLLVGVAADVSPSLGLPTALGVGAAAYLTLVAVRAAQRARAA